MEELVQQFRREASQRAGQRYSAELRRTAVEYAQWASRAGRSGGQIAGALGLPAVTLERWRRSRVPASQIHEVKVVGGGGEATRLVLVMPSGVRVEGLRIEELVEILG